MAIAGPPTYDALAKAKAVIDQIMPSIEQKLLSGKTIDVGAILNSTMPVVPLSSMTAGSLAGPAALAAINSALQTPELDEELNTRLRKKVL